MTDWNHYDTLAIGINSYTDFLLLEKYAKGKILDVGCGRGKVISSLNGERYGIDISEQAISQATGGVYKVGSATDIPFPDKMFDFTYSLEVIEHIPDYKKMISEMKRVTKRGGYMYIQTPNYPTKRLYDILYFLLGRKNTWKDDYTHVSLFSWVRLKHAMKGLTIKEVVTRNILGENKLPFLKKIKSSPLGLWIGQKTIIVVEVL